MFLQINNINRHILSNKICDIFNKKCPKNIYLDLKYIPLGSVSQDDLKHLISSQVDLNDNLVYSVLHHLDEPDMLQVTIPEWILLFLYDQEIKIISSLQTNNTPN